MRTTKRKDKELLDDIERIKNKYSQFKGLELPDAILRIAAELEKRMKDNGNQTDYV